MNQCIGSKVLAILKWGDLKIPKDFKSHKAVLNSPFYDWLRYHLPFGLDCAFKSGSGKVVISELINHDGVYRAGPGLARV